MKVATILLNDTKAKGKGRPRFTTRGKFVRTYTPKDTQDYCKLIRHEFIDKYGYEFKEYNDVVRMNIRVNYAVPKSLSNKKKRELLYSPYLKKPDCDNIEKSIMDALNGVAYVDDCQVYDVHTIKRYNTEDFIIIEVIYEKL